MVKKVGQEVAIFQQTFQISNRIPRQLKISNDAQNFNFVPKFSYNGVFRSKLCIFGHKFSDKKNICWQISESPKFTGKGNCAPPTTMSLAAPDIVHVKMAKIHKYIKIYDL